ncbi:MAG: FtsQ-type POTRA domain-containing protein, partial [Oscillospiraceae bacterium]
LYKLISVLLICAAIVAALTLFFKVETTQVTGTSRYTAQEVLVSSGVKQGDNLFLLNKNAVASQIVHQLPYVEEVRIHRTLPATLRIEVTECDAAGVIVQEGAGWLISPGGKIIEKIAPAKAKDYAVIDGCTLLTPAVSFPLQMEDAHKQKEMLTLLGALRDGGMLPQTDAIHLGDPAAVTMDYGDRFAVRFVWGADYGYKLQNLQAVIDKLEVNETGVVDLTLDGEAHFIP